MKSASERTLPPWFSRNTTPSRSNAAPSVVRTSQPRPTCSFASPGASLDRLTLPPFCKLIAMVFLLFWISKLLGVSQCLRVHAQRFLLLAVPDRRPYRCADECHARQARHQFRHVELHTGQHDHGQDADGV